MYGTILCQDLHMDDRYALVPGSHHVWYSLVPGFPHVW